MSDGGVYRTAPATPAGSVYVLHLKDVYVLVFLAKHSNILSCLHCLSLATNLKRVSRSLL